MGATSKLYRQCFFAEYLQGRISKRGDSSWSITKFLSATLPTMHRSMIFEPGRVRRILRASPTVSLFGYRDLGEAKKAIAAAGMAFFSSRTS